MAYDSYLRFDADEKMKYEYSHNREAETHSFIYCIKVNWKNVHAILNLHST